MTMGTRDILENIIFVLKIPKYAFLVLLLSAILFFIFIFLNNIPLFVSAFEITQNLGTLTKVFLNAVDMILDIGGVAVFGSVVAVSILGGLSITLISYKMVTTRKLSASHGLLNFSGIFGGALSSACAACSTALISIIGVAGGLAIFPLKGLELSLISIAVLLMSLYFISKNLLGSDVCTTKLGVK